MTETRSNLAVVLTAIGLGCGGTAQAGAENAALAQSMEGRVRLTGSEPAIMTVLETSNGSVMLAGDLLGELQRLAGATVRVDGEVTGAGPARRMRVSSYAVTMIGGSRPLVGVLVERDDGVWLMEEAAGTTTVRLVAPPPALRREIGAKVWIVGDREGAGVRPRSFGIIRPPR